MVTRMTDAPTSPDRTSDDGAARMISGAVQYDGDDIVVVPQPGVKNPYVPVAYNAKAGNEAQAKLLGAQPVVESDKPATEPAVVKDETKDVTKSQASTKPRRKPKGSDTDSE